ncbi:MAG: ATP-binding cassette domain-containing protein [Thermofilum sp.]|jgi:ABC-type Mn2+/Zn2+ transport system ATPase subunit|nr:ATP-binding cassette domain-containing protein [Thermofilum sp.]
MGAIRIGLRDVYVTYQDAERPALRKVNLLIGEGKLVIITGPNGSGKTTLLETCLGLLKPLKGTVELLGMLTTSRKIHRARKLCSYLPQNFMRSPYESYTVKQIIGMGLLSIKGFPSTLTHEDLHRIRSVAEILGIDNLLDEPIGKLSGGQQQRAFLARALVREPLVLLLDEPFSSIDPAGRERIISLLDKYARERDATVLIVSHVVDRELSRVADAVVTMSDGELVSIVGNPY